MAKEKDKKKFSLYVKSLLIFAIVLLLLGGMFLSYVYRSLVTYEDNLIENIMDTMLNDGSLAEKYDGNFEISSYENNKDIKKSLKELYKSDSIKYKLDKSASTDELYVYNIMNEDNIITKVSLKIESKETKMALLTVNHWKIEDISYNFENGFYSYDILIPSNYQLKINGQNVLDDDLASETIDKKLERVSQYIEIPKTKNYVINNLLSKPKIEIINEEGKEVDYEVKNNKIVVENNYKSVSYDELKKTLKADIDVLKLAENWSLFLTNDLKGGTRGFQTLSPYLIKDSYMYNMAHGWATGIDITFVSRHYLLNPVFTDEGIENCTIYSDDAFSCEVKLKKNMKLYTGVSKIDEMHDDLFFVYYENGYKLVDMQSRAE